MLQSRLHACTGRTPVKIGLAVPVVEQRPYGSAFSASLLVAEMPMQPVMSSMRLVIYVQLSLIKPCGFVLETPANGHTLDGSPNNVARVSSVCSCSATPTSPAIPSESDLTRLGR